MREKIMTIQKAEEETNQPTTGAAPNNKPAGLQRRRQSWTKGVMLRPVLRIDTSRPPPPASGKGPDETSGDDGPQSPWSPSQPNPFKETAEISAGKEPMSPTS